MGTGFGGLETRFEFGLLVFSYLYVISKLEKLLVLCHKIKPANKFDLLLLPKLQCRTLYSKKDKMEIFAENSDSTVDP